MNTSGDPYIAEGDRLGVPLDDSWSRQRGLCLSNCSVCRAYRNAVRKAQAAERGERPEGFWYDRFSASSIEDQIKAKQAELLGEEPKVSLRKDTPFDPDALASAGGEYVLAATTYINLMQVGADQDLLALTKIILKRAAEAYLAAFPKE